MLLVSEITIGPLWPWKLCIFGFLYYHHHQLSKHQQFDQGFQSSLVFYKHACQDVQVNVENDKMQKMGSYIYGQQLVQKY